MKAFLVLIGLLIYLFFVPPSAAQEAHAAEGPPGGMVFAVTCSPDGMLQKYMPSLPSDEVTVVVDGQQLDALQKKVERNEPGSFRRDCWFARVEEY